MNNKKIFTISLLLLATIIFSCNGQNKQSSSIGIKLFIPQNWFVDIDSKELLMITSPGIKTYNDEPRVTLLLTKENSNVTYEQAIKQVIQNSLKINVETIVINTKEITINNNQWVLYETESPSIGSYAQYYFLKLNSYFYTFAIVTNKIDYQILEIELNKILNSIIIE